jgi:Ca2+-binding RTX toxin-like protein
MATITGTSLADSLTGTSGDDDIYGLDGDDYLYGYAGNDWLEGGLGNDIIDGGTGDDVMIGGAGNDIYYVDSSSDVVVEASGGGTDTVRLQMSAYTAAANIEIVDMRYAPYGAVSVVGNGLANTFLMGWGAMSVNGGAGSDTVSYYSLGSVTVDLATGEQTNAAADDILVGIENLTGSQGDDTLRGNSAANILDGGTGADILVGRAGNDVYIVDDSGDSVVEAAGEGSDEVRVTLLSAYTLAANVERMTNLGSSTFTGYGNALNNDLTGGYGNDWLYGQDGNDNLVGGIGFDHLFGGNGNDTLSGGQGMDYLFGGLGNDTYVVDTSGDIITEYEGEGTDTIYASLDSYSLPDYVEVLIANISGDFHGTGNDDDNVLWGAGGDDYLDGTWGNDEVRGGDGDDLMFGGYGDDLLVGGHGADVMIGGDGADVFRIGAGDTGVGAAADLVADLAQGQDEVDLIGIDANLLAPGDQAFTFIGGDAFSGTAGELRFEYDGSSYTWLQGDLDGDGVPDLEVRFNGNVDLVVSDFLL